MAHSKTIIIRPIRSEDEPEWRRLWRAYLAFYQTERPEEVYATSFSRLLAGAPGDFRGFLAEIDGRAVGLTHYLFHRHMWSVADACYLQDLYADPEARGQGVGRALIEAVYAAADEHGAASVYWLTQDFNARARVLYDRIGEKTPFIKYQRARA